MPLMPARGGTEKQLLIFLDVGDLFTKGLVVSPASRQRLRFPSVVASRLLDGGTEAHTLLLDGSQALPRPVDFDPKTYLRVRSFAGGQELVAEARQQAVGQARFAGWIAATYGADRQLVASHPSEENIDSLVRKAFIQVGATGACRAEVAFVVDTGAKANALSRYVAGCPRQATLVLRNLRTQGRRRLEVDFSARVMDAADCASAEPPADALLARLGRLLLVDIGYRRTKLALLSRDGCEHQEEIADLGVAFCLHRILRDGQDQGLVEDELAVVEAFEKPPHHIIEVAGRRFDVRDAYHSALRVLELELARAMKRVALEQYQRSGEVCRGAMILGGGAHIAGAGLLALLEKSDGGFTTVRVADDPGYLLLQGASRRLGRSSPT